MGLTSLKTKIQKRVNIEKYKNNYTDIGTFIKEKRKELNVTQDEISDGVCSISYLSKIENNQIIPNDYYVREILDKLNVDEEILRKSLKEKDYLEKMLNAIFYMNDYEIESIYHEIKDVEHNVVINLCKLGYTVYFGFKDDNQYVMMLEHLITNMTDFEVGVYLYFSAIFFVQKEKYKTGLELTLLYDELRSKEEKLDALFYDLSYLIKQRLLVKNSSNEDYYHAMNLYHKYHNIERVMMLALNKSYHLKNENPKGTLKILKTVKEKLLNGELKDMYYFIKATALFELKKYQDATLLLNHIDETSKYYLRKMNLLIEICIKENDLTMIDNIKELLNHFAPHSEELKSKVYYHFITQNTKEDKKEFLRDIAIPFSIKIEDYNSLKFYVDHVMELCMENSRYKEALQYYKKYQKEMVKIQKILY